MINKLAHYAGILILTLTPIVASAYEASFYASSSPLGNARWVKIAIDTTGVYEISEAQLREWGFTNTSEVNIYGYGGVLAHDQYFNGAVPDNLPMSPAVRTDDGRIVFYAEGPVRASFKGTSRETVEIHRNYYDRKAYYFLSDRKTGTKQKIHEYRESASPTVNWHYNIGLIENELNGFDGGVVFHSKRLVAGDAEDMLFKIRDFGWTETRTPHATFKVETAVNAPKSLVFNLDFSNNVTVDSKSRPANSSNVSSAILYTKGEGAAVLTPTSTDCDVEVSVGVPSTASMVYAAVDRAYMIYPRQNIIRPDEPELMLNYSGITDATNISISGGNKDVQIWDVTDPAGVTVLEPRISSSGMAYASIPGSGNRRIIAFNPQDRHRSIYEAGHIENQNIHCHAVPDMIIVTVGSLKSAADGLADIHRRYGLDVLVVVQEDAFNEFGSGSRTPAAIRRMIKMFYDRNPSKLKYVLLYGSSTSDPRFIKRPVGDYLLTHECEIMNVCRDSGANYATDMYYGMVSDNYNPLRIEIEPVKISVGRLSPNDLPTALETNNKIKAYLDNPPSPASMLRVLRCSDDDNEGIHLRHAQIMVDTMLTINNKLTVTRADILYYPLTGNKAPVSTELIRNSLSRGVGYFHYNGHGSYSGISGESIYSSGDAKTLVYDTPPLMMFSSCSAYSFDLKPNSLCEAATLSPRGGAIGGIGSTRSVYLDFNRILSLGISRAYAEAKNGWSGADIFRVARDYLIRDGKLSGDAGNNALCFNYAGDPAVPMPFAGYNILIDTPHTDELKSHTPIMVKARVIDSNGATVRGYNGTAMIEVYEGTVTHKPLKEVEDMDGENFNDYLMGEYHAVVKDGNIEASIVLPDVYQGLDGCRIVITATPAQGKVYAAGVLFGGSITSPDGNDSSPDNSPARILDFYIDPADYSSTDIVGTDFTVHAVIDPSPSGISTGNTGVRNRFNMVMDETSTFPTLQNQIRYDADGKAKVDLTLSNISFGPHTLRLDVPNNAGITSSEYLSFNVGTPTLTGSLSIDNDGPVRDNALFSLYATSEAKRLIITDAEGSTVLSVKNPVFPYRWNLTDNDGRSIGDGCYKAWAILESDLAKGATSPLEVIVIK